MGLFSFVGDFFDDISGKSSEDARNNAARSLQPFIDFSAGQLPQLGSDATLAGFGNSIASILGVQPSGGASYASTLPPGSPALSGPNVGQPINGDASNPLSQIDRSQLSGNPRRAVGQIINQIKNPSAITTRNFDSFGGGLVDRIRQSIVEGVYGAAEEAQQPPPQTDFSNVFQPLVDERFRYANQQLANAGVRRSGQAARTAAKIPTDIAFAIESELNRRRAQNAGIAFDATNAANSNRIAGADARASGSSGILDGLLSGVAAIFSDERLKTGINKVGSLGPLDVIEWEWNEEAYDKLGLFGRSKGFSAQQTLAHFPEQVSVDNKTGYYVIDYSSILEKVKNAH